MATVKRIYVEKKVLSAFEYSILLSILGEGAFALENLENEKAKKELEYKNRDMKDTIKDTIKWLKRMNYIK